MLAILAKLGIGSIVSKIADAYVARENAKTTAERIAADERIKALEAKRDVQIAEGGSKINSLIRFLFAAPVAVYYAKLFVYDKALGLGATDALSTELQNFALMVVSFYFVADATTTMARIIKRR